MALNERTFGPAHVEKYISILNIVILVISFIAVYCRLLENLEDLGQRIVLKWILRKQGRRVWT
jgi:hypothetical protein